MQTTFSYIEDLVEESDEDLEIEEEEGPHQIKSIKKSLLKK